MSVLGSVLLARKGTRESGRPSLLRSTPTLKNAPLLTLLFLLSALPLGSAACYNATGNKYGCMLCLSDDYSSVIGCSYYSSNNDNCASACCGLNYIVAIPSNCYSFRTAGTDTSISVSTIIVIVVFSIPVVICVLLLFHACLDALTRRAAQSVRVPRASRAPTSSVNLASYNLEESFPYQIDPSQSCSICLEDRCHVMTLCGHSYHSVCLRAWIKKR